MGLYGGPTGKLNKFLKGKTVEKVEDFRSDEGAMFQMKLRQKSTGPLWYCRISGGDLGWWFETRLSDKGKWKRG